MKKIIKVTNFDECPHCGSRLMSGLGVVSKCTQVLHRYHNYYSNKSEYTYDDLDVEKTLGYYCPNCGKDIDTKLGEKIEQELTNV